MPARSERRIVFLVTLVLVHADSERRGACVDMEVTIDATSCQTFPIARLGPGALGP